MILFDVKAISLHPDLRLSSQPFLKKMKRYLLKNGIQPIAYARINSPFVYTVGQHLPQLLSHHFVYMLVKNSGEKSFYATEVTQAQIDDVLAIDKLNVALLEQAMLNNKVITSQTESHHKRRSAQQVCPFCSGPLTAQKSKKGRIRNGKEYFEVKCLYRHYPQYNCDFSTEMEKLEYILFKKNLYPTIKWLKKLDSKRCPRCKDLLFERKVPDGKVFHQCRKTLIRHLPDKEYCDYRIAPPR